MNRMKQNLRTRWAALALALALTLGLSACGSPKAADSTSGSFATSAVSEPPGNPAEPPQEPGEYRAMWVSYLEWQKFDFSSAPAFTAAVETLLDNCAALGLNTVIAQVRPFGDALYPSSLFPWSSLCGGADPGFDPLAILVEQAHARGLRLEAWVNPYRVRLNAATPGPMSGGLDESHPDWCRVSGEGLYLDPSSAEVQDYITAGVQEIVEQYVVDGIQFDDYFYPTTEESFDAEEFNASGTGLELAEWRRGNVNALVQKVYAAVHSSAPAGRSVTFGISPQGNNDNNYNGQYSDVALWLSTPGYVDYIMPQLYWGYGYTTKGGRTDYAFENISAAWAAMARAPGVRLYFGLGAYRIGVGDGGNYENNTAQWQTGHELADMVATLRQAGADGYALYRYDFLFNNPDWSDLAAAECENLAGSNAP